MPSTNLFDLSNRVALVTGGASTLVPHRDREADAVC